MAIGTRLSPGVYRNPTGGGVFRSQTGQIRIPRTPTTPQTGGGLMATGSSATQKSTTATPNLAQLQGQRAQLHNEMVRRGGAAKAQGFAKQFQNVTGQIRTLNNPKLIELQAKRDQLHNEMVRRGGAAKAGGFAKQFQDVSGQIRLLRNPAQTGTTTDATGAANTAADAAGQTGTTTTGDTAAWQPSPELTALQGQRAQLAKEVQRRGGRANALGFAKQLDALDAKIGGMRNSEQTATGTTTDTTATGETVPGTGGGVSAVNDAGGAITNLKPLQDQRKRLVAEVQRRGGRAKAQGFAKQLDALDAKISGIRKTNATGTTPPPGGETTPPPGDTTGDATGDTTTDTTATDTKTAEDIANTLFPNTRMFEPENYEGSPLYQFQLQEGQKALSRSLAKRGLGNSGHAIEEELNMPLRVAAQDTDRMTRVAEGNADRLFNIQNNEANRMERRDDAQWGRLYDTASLLAAQSPWDAALGGLDASAGFTEKAGSARANFLKEYYKRAIGGGGGGGGGGTPINIPSGPDYSNIDPYSIGGNYSSNKGWLNILNGALGGLFST